MNNLACFAGVGGEGERRETGREVVYCEWRRREKEQGRESQCTYVGEYVLLGRLRERRERERMRTKIDD